MPIPLNQVTHAEIVMRCVLTDATAGNKNTANVFHFRRLAVAVDPVKASVTAAFDTAIAQVYLAAATSNVQQAKIGVRWLDDPSDIEVITAATPLTVGQIATDPLPYSNCVSMLLKSGQRGHSRKGAKRFAGVAEADTTGELLSGAGLARWQTLRTAMLTGFTDADGNDWRLSVVSRKLSDLLASPAVIDAVDVTSIPLNKTIGSQDTRRPPTVR